MSEAVDHAMEQLDNALADSYAREKALQAEVERLRAVADAARLVLDATAVFPAKYPHVGTLRYAVADLDRQATNPKDGGS